MKIETETNYRQFRFTKGNRPVVPNKVNKLVAVVKGGLNLFKYCPILVNEDMFVIDGQHRLEACKKLNLPIFYVVVPSITLLQIAQLNATATRWKTDDFFNCFIQTGNKDYNALQLFQQKYNLSVNVAVQLLMTGGVIEGGSRSETFKEGKFKIVHQEKAVKIMNAVYSFEKVAESIVLKDRSFIRAVQLLLQSSKYNHKEVVEKLTTKKCEIVKKQNYKEYIFHIEELFNRGNSIRRIIYDNQKSLKP